MFFNYVFHFLTTLYLSSSVLCQTPCSFNAKCICSSVSVQCIWDTPTFPAFSVDNSTLINQINISIQYTGNETIVLPENAFVPLRSLQKQSLLYFDTNYDDCKLAPILQISPGAFNTYRNTSFQVISFNTVKIRQLSSYTFQLVTIDYILSFFTSCIGTVDDFTFSGLNVNYIQVYQNGAGNPELTANSLSGINFTGLGSEIEFNSFGVTDFLPFKMVSVTQLYVEYNTFANIQDFAFCSCNTLGQCNNTVLKSIYLDNNNIEYVSQLAFANLGALAQIDLSYNKLKSIAFAGTITNGLNLAGNQLVTFSGLVSVKDLYLSDNQMTDIPTSGILPLANSLQMLVLSNNSFVELQSNSFYGLNNLTKLNVNLNPIATIDPGAFNGLPSIVTFILSNMTALNSVDLLITYGMTDLDSLLIGYSQIQNVFVSDATKLPSTLTTVIVSEVSSLQQIDSSLESWLLLDEGHIYSFSYNTQFPCNDNIQWMAKYAICNPAQITVSDTTCQDGTDALTFLKTFNPQC